MISLTKETVTYTTINAEGKEQTHTETKRDFEVSLFGCACAGLGMVCLAWGAKAIINVFKS